MLQDKQRIFLREKRECLCAETAPKNRFKTVRRESLCAECEKIGLEGSSELRCLSVALVPESASGVPGMSRCARLRAHWLIFFGFFLNSLPLLLGDFVWAYPQIREVIHRLARCTY